MCEGGKQRSACHLAEIRIQVINKSFCRAGQRDGPDDQNHQENEENRHQDGRPSLNAFDHSGGDDAHGDDHEQGLPDDRFPYTAYMVLKNTGMVNSRGACGNNDLVDIRKGPAGDDSVIGKNDKAGKDTECAHQPPGAVRGKNFKDADGVALRCAS